MNSENIIKDNKALRAESMKSAPNKEAVSTQIAEPFIGKIPKPHQNYSESLASDKDSSLGVIISQILAKFQQYQEKILNDTNLELKLNLFVEPLTSYRDSTTGENRLLELSYEIARQFLTSLSSKDPRILLLTGQAGAGKSFFCQHLQREILSKWHKNPESDDDENWFPIYVELSSLKNPKSEAITETFARELSLTEEEISFLRTTDQTTLKLPRLLFIFDGYDEIEDIHAFHSLDSKEDLVKHNFFELNKIHEESWKNAKFIITCREENLQKVQRKDHLFGPVSADPGSFLKRSIEPFSDEQIRYYLKKYYIFEQFSLLPALLNCMPSDLTQKSRSWEEVQLLEQLIDRFTLREIARVPSMLRIICQILPNITSKDLGRKSAEDPTQSEVLSDRFLLDFFVSEIIKTNLKRTLEAMNSSPNQEESKGELEEVENQKVDSYIKAINRQIQNFALRSGGYSVNEVKTENEAIDDSSLILKSHPFVKWDSSHSRVKFYYPWIREFLIAKRIEEEIREKVPSSALQDGKLETPRDLLINQRLLTYGASNTIVLLLLRDAVNDKRLTTEQLMKLIDLSREKGVELDSDFAVAAANAITVLNVAGFDFSYQDLSSISIPGANLSYGIFEETNFRNANLRGVSFTCSWLEDANLEHTNLENLELGEILGLRLRNEEIFNIAYSFDGKYLAVGMGDQTVIFENVGPHQNDFKEIRRVPGSFLYCRGLPFSMDGKQIITIIKKRLASENEGFEDIGGLWENEEGIEEEKVEEEIAMSEGKSEEDPQSDHIKICFWDVISGHLIEELSVPIGNKKLLIANPRRKEVMALDGNEVKKYSIETDSWSKFSITNWDEATNCELNAEDCNTLLMRDFQKRVRLYSAVTGKPILKLKQRATTCKFSQDGKQIISRTSRGLIDVVDTARGYNIKPLSPSQLGNSSFQSNGQIFFTISRDKLILQDMSATQTTLKIPLKNEPKDRSYSISIDLSAKQVAYFSENTGVVYFERLPTTTISSAPMTAIRGSNNKGLNLHGVIVSSCDKLSEKNIVILQKRGDYGAFQETILNKLFPSNPEEFNDVREVIAINKNLTPIHARIIGSNTCWNNLQKLDLSMNAIGEEGGEVIGSNKSWPNLEVLTLLDAQIGNSTAIKVANNQTWKNLKKLELASNHISDIGAIEIGKSKLWVNLEVLDLRNNQIEDKGANAIGGNNTWEKLIRLDLSSNKINDNQTIIFVCSNGTWKNLKHLLLGGNPVVFEGADTIKAIEGIASMSLEGLTLPNTEFGHGLLHYLKNSAPESVKEISLIERGYNAIHTVAIGGNTTWINLQTLHLEKNRIRDEGATGLSRNTSWTNLQSLHLKDNSIPAKGAADLATNTYWTNLQTLGLEDNWMVDEGAIGLSKNTSWTNLQTLNLNSNRIGHEGAIALGQNTSWTNLQSLDLLANEIRDKGAAGLSQNTTWTKLQTLNLGHNKIGNKGATDLGKNTSWTNLQTLNLVANKICDEGAIGLSQNTSWTNLATLNLGYNLIGGKGAAGLGQNATWISLQTLELGRNSIDAKGATDLRKNTTWTKLQSLDLMSNKIGDEGAIGLSLNKTWTNLQTLNLESNKIGVEGALGLSKNATWTNLQELTLKYNQIGDEGAAALSKNTTWINLQRLNLSFNSIEKGAIELKENQNWPKDIRIIL